MPFKTNNFLNSTIHGFISTSNSEQKEQTNKEKYVFYCNVSQIHGKNTKMTSSDDGRVYLPIGNANAIVWRAKKHQTEKNVPEKTSKDFM